MFGGHQSLFARVLLNWCQEIGINHIIWERGKLSACKVGVENQCIIQAILIEMTSWNWSQEFITLSLDSQLIEVACLTFFIQPVLETIPNQELIIDLNANNFSLRIFSSDYMSSNLPFDAVFESLFQFKSLSLHYLRCGYLLRPTDDIGLLERLRGQCWQVVVITAKFDFKIVIKLDSSGLSMHRSGT